MEGDKKEPARIGPGQGTAVLVGPEGGFDEREIRRVPEMGVRPVSPRERVLRTETAGLTMLLVIMMRLEGAL